jgi:FkbM family methyltransferase
MVHVDFLQIGAHVGRSPNDHLFSKDMDKKHLILIEPVPYLFETLKENYRARAQNNTIEFYNIAISDHDGSLTLYVPSANNDFSRYPFWASQLASTNADHIKTHLPDLKVDCINVVCTSLNSLVRFKNITSIDTLYIDTEGHDYDILMAYDLSLVKPKSIQFENKHMDGVFQKGPKYQALLAHFAAHGYIVVTEGIEDTLLQNLRL